jgi:hypothetical protein
MQMGSSFYSEFKDFGGMDRKKCTSENYHWFLTMNISSWAHQFGLMSFLTSRL